MPISSKRIAQQIKVLEAEGGSYTANNHLKILLLESLTSTQQVVFDKLEEAKQPLTADEIKDTCNLSRSHILVCLTELEDLNLIERNIKDGQFYYHAT